MDDNFVSRVVSSLGFSNPSAVGYHEVVGHLQTFVDNENPDIDAHRGHLKFLDLVKWFVEWMENEGIFVEDLMKDEEFCEEDDDAYEEE